jgi:hypothetical protein
MKFYDCATAPSPRRVRIFLAEKGLTVPTVQVDLRNGEQFTPAFRALNPFKLALAGREKNWSYAAYEHHQLEEAFDRVARYWPQWRSFPIADMMTPVTKEPMTMLSEAIKSANADQYNLAYTRLTDGCNACHQATNVGVNVIVTPDASTFPDQDFRPAKP